MPAEPARAPRLATAPEPPDAGVMAPEAPAQPRWWGRPLAETRWQLELMRLLRAIPVDARHNAKIDYPALVRMLEKL